MESAVISMNVRIATIPPSEPTTALHPTAAGSHRVLHLNSLIIYVIINIYTFLTFKIRNIHNKKIRQRYKSQFLRYNYLNFTMKNTINHVKYQKY